MRIQQAEPAVDIQQSQQLLLKPLSATWLCLDVLGQGWLQHECCAIQKDETPLNASCCWLSSHACMLSYVQNRLQGCHLLQQWWIHKRGIVCWPVVYVHGVINAPYAAHKHRTPAQSCSGFIDYCLTTLWLFAINIAATDAWTYYVMKRTAFQGQTIEQVVLVTGGAHDTKICNFNTACHLLWTPSAVGVWQHLRQAAVSNEFLSRCCCITHFQYFVSKNYVHASCVPALWQTMSLLPQLLIAWWARGSGLHRWRLQVTTIISRASQSSWALRAVLYQIELLKVIVICTRCLSLWHS